MHPSLLLTWRGAGLVQSADLCLQDFTVTLESAAGGYLLNIRAKASHTGLVNDCPVLIDGDVRLDGGTRPCVGALVTRAQDGPLVLRGFPVPVGWTVPISYEALDAIERHRAGGELRLQLSLHAPARRRPP